MPLYYFDFRDGTGLLRDDEGFEHPDIDAAEREAMEVAAGIGRDRFPQGDRSITVEVRDERASALRRRRSLCTSRGGTDPSIPLVQYEFISGRFYFGTFSHRCGNSGTEGTFSPGRSAEAVHGTECCILSEKGCRG